MALLVLATKKGHEEGNATLTLTLNVPSGRCRGPQIVQAHLVGSRSVSNHRSAARTEI